jgi:cell division protein FtsA
MPADTIFALDIGTRSVVGVVIQGTARGLEIVAAESLEYQERAMIDGQIHDVEQVAAAVKKIKAAIEERLGQSLGQVAVAAAGRALRTVRIQIASQADEYREITTEDILRIEMQAVQEAQHQLAMEEQEGQNPNYHCVGYSVINYELDGYRIGNLSGQKGKNIGVEIIVTFLPRVVVDSLFAVLQRAGLEMLSLTLEPIAASTVVVPPSMRQLNIALVDIGAGTSDIALTSDGAVVGYGMVPTAGDEVTERISQHYLLDFNRAEELKRAATELEEVEFTDVLGISHRLPAKEVIGAMEEAVSSLAMQIGEKIVNLNQKPPQAVICIGGGSMTPMLQDKLAENLGLSRQRVALRGREAIMGIFGAQEMMGPEAVTPIGIAVTAHEKRGLGFATVTVNGRPYRLFEINRGTVADALLAAGINMKKLQPRLGLALTVVVNGELNIIKGGRGTPAMIRLNGEEAALDAEIRHGDVVEVREAMDGRHAAGTVADVVPVIEPLKLFINDNETYIKPVIIMNDTLVDYNTPLVDNAAITYYLPKTLGEVMEITGWSGPPENYRVFINGQEVNPKLDLMEELLPEDVIRIEAAVVNLEVEQQTAFAGDSGEAAAAAEEQTRVYVNDEEILFPRNNLILTDVFTKISFSLLPPGPGARLEMKVNGYQAEFTTPLKSGDRIILEWIQ